MLVKTRQIIANLPSNYSTITQYFTNIYPIFTVQLPNKNLPSIDKKVKNHLPSILPVFTQ